jgi:hypothetical protein
MAQMTIGHFSAIAYTGFAKGVVCQQTIALRLSCFA